MVVLVCAVIPSHRYKVMFSRESDFQVLGGLLSAHLLASDPERGLYPASAPYSGGLLPLAHELGGRLLPAFNTPTGIPYGNHPTNWSAASKWNAQVLSTCRAACRQMRRLCPLSQELALCR